jgi:hypothetical protein
MNEGLQTRISYGSAAAIAISYFLPWLSAVTPLGSIQLKGQFLDYAWILFALSVLYLTTQSASANAEALGIPSDFTPRLVLASRVIPFLLFGFIVWSGANFEFGLHAGTHSTLFGGDLSLDIHAGLDYGYWIALLSALCLLTVTALRLSQVRPFIGTGLTVFAITVLLAFAHNRPAKAAPHTYSGSALSSAAGAVSSASDPADATFDASPYVNVVSVTGRTLSKNYDAQRYEDSVDIGLKFRNLTDKTITGLRGRVAVLDGFGKAAYSFGFRDDDKIRPKSEEGSGAYNFDHNQFEDDDPYSKMYPLISADTAKYKVTITNIAFSDGTILPSSK